MHTDISRSHVHLASPVHRALHFLQKQVQPLSLQVRLVLPTTSPSSGMVTTLSSSKSPEHHPLLFGLYHLVIGATQTAPTTLREKANWPVVKTDQGDEQGIHRRNTNTQ